MCCVDRVLLMCDYLAEPLWTPDGGMTLSLDGFPLSAGAKKDLRAWAQWYDSLLDRDCSWEAGEQENFEREGRRLWRAVRAELSGVYEVGYFSQTLHRQVWEPDELEAGTHRGA